MLSENIQKWTEIFDLVGIKIENVSQNCCGMAGFYGYQKENYSLSESLFNNNIGKFDHHNLFFDGISCLLQNQRLSAKNSSHIIKKLSEII